LSAAPWTPTDLNYVPKVVTLDDARGSKRRNAMADNHLEFTAPARLARVLAWGQRVEPKPGTKIGLRSHGWELYRDGAGGDYYEAEGVYFGFGFVALDDSYPTAD
jgi:hypothetical protein